MGVDRGTRPLRPGLVGLPPGRSPGRPRRTHHPQARRFRRPGPRTARCVDPGQPRRGRRCDRLCPGRRRTGLRWFPADHPGHEHPAVLDLGHPLGRSGPGRGPCAGKLPPAPAHVHGDLSRGAEPMSAGLVVLGILVLLVLRVPIAFAILGPCLVYMAATDQSTGLSLRTAAQEINSFPLLAVPLFILLGVVANHTGIADRIFAFAQVLFGRVRASLGYVNVGVSVGFSWISGTALADVAAMGKMLVPAMTSRGYPRRFALGLTASSSLISPVMPPSIPAIVYASVAAVSTAALFAAAVVPAFLIAAGLALYVFLWSRKQPQLAGRPARPGEFRTAALRVIGPLGAPVLLLGGILSGLFTPTEAAAVGVAYVVVLGFCYRRLTLGSLWGIAVEPAPTAAAIALILAASGLLGWVLARERV